ncbi:hypothetical protein GCK72_011466 [Caenorhabditis remanei]|uniref:Uncharacterized protein n=1 Tax=Caenorhabditis remanei TaxID=31234 RepID=A0A6A5H5V7_CAERE|nr:hypothetical protein GCK72_011466 [Caenorhabditis remanei]KAF1763200.1 hypothetical protein GCK72_011466 [Caenorhabditis remanei]
MGHHHHNPNSAPFQQFLNAFGLDSIMSVDEVSQRLLNQRQLIDIDGSREYVNAFIKKCEKRDPNSIKPLRKRVDAVMDSSQEMTLMMDFLVRCRQTHLFRIPTTTSEDNRSIGGSSSLNTVTPTPSIQSSPFQRRSASRGRVLSTMSEF